MNYYIDFDCTLYDTDALTKAMLVCVAKNISENDVNIPFNEAYSEAESMFNSNNIYNIFTLCEHFSNKYNISSEKLISEINLVIDNGEKFVYDDSVEFLNNLKTNLNNITLLTFSPKERLDYQKQKVKGSGLMKFFDNIIFTTEPKWQLDIDYRNGVFIDNNPTDLLNLYNTNPIEVIRVRRITDKYTLQDLPKGVNIKEYKKIIDIIK